MDAVTYPSSPVVTFVSGNLIAVRVPADSPLAKEFRVQWTPTLLVLDPGGNEHYRTVGFLSPADLIPSLLLGMAKCHFDAGRFSDALPELEEIAASYSESDFAAEATYLKGVCKFERTHKPEDLKEAYEELKVRYPGSPWEKRAAPYALL